MDIKSRKHPSTSISPATFSCSPSSGHRLVPKPAEGYNLSCISWIHPGDSSQKDMPEISSRGILIKHLNLRGAALLSLSCSPIANNEPKCFMEETHFGCMHQIFHFFLSLSTACGHSKGTSH